MVLQVTDDEVIIKWYDGPWSCRKVESVHLYKASQNSEPAIYCLGENPAYWGHYHALVNQFMLITKGKLGDLYISLESDSTSH